MLQKERRNSHQIQRNPHPSASTAERATGETAAKRTRHWRAGGSFSRITDCATTVEEGGTLAIIAEAVAVLIAKGDTIQASATERRILFSLCTRHLPRRHSQLSSPLRSMEPHYGRTLTQDLAGTLSQKRQSKSCS